ncbi:MAG: glycoside hydrolase family 13 protein [Bifidobacteriaceae bacterium]|jgi:alpha-glucosidase|nr:glycoside hydrolase family 13 protein [Bifidobacteriaceae bacterium]
MPRATQTEAAAEWWRDGIVYQVYPRSFADSDGDGLGDLRGVTSRVAYLAELGVDAVWLSPFYPSALADGGYDVDDYRAVDPALGTLADFDQMVAALHGAGIGVIVDIVPNHTSNRHVWFRQALASPKGSPARDRYIFRDGRGPGAQEPPADWVAAFGGPAWTPTGDGQFYLHLFAPEQPDLNWDNPEVRADFLKTLRFWADRGVDGFRVDVAHALAKDLTEPLPSWAQLQAMTQGPDHPLWDRDELDQIYAEWRAVFNEYDPPRWAVAEAWVEVPQRRARYATAQSLGQAFNFDLLQADFDAAEFRLRITRSLEAARAAGSSSTWVLSNHDVIRHATRHALPPAGPPGPDARNRAWLVARRAGQAPPADQALGLRRARCATQVILALPGSAYLYQGEELGLPEVVDLADLPDGERQDPTFFRSAGFDIGRDGARVPLPWTEGGPSFGFSPGAGPAHMAQPRWFGAFSVEAELKQPDSTLRFYRQALGLRRALLADLPPVAAAPPGPGPVEAGDSAPAALAGLVWLDAPAGALRFARGGWQCVANFTAAPFALPAGDLLLTSAPLEDGRLGPATCAWLRPPPDAARPPYPSRRAS